MQDISKLSSACVKCGKCIPKCTIYRANRDEVTSPRGFLDLLGAHKRGDLELDSVNRHIFESCFLCTTCVSECPSSLGVDTAIERVRIEIAQKFGISWYKRAYFYLLRHRKVADLVFRFCSFLAPCGFKHDKQSDRWISRGRFFKGLGGKWSKRSIFPFAKKSFLETYRGDVFALDSEKASEARGEGGSEARGEKEGKSSEARGKKSSELKESAQKRRVAIFIGCLSNYNYVGVGEALLEILRALHIGAFVPHLQQCCGAPAFFTGDNESVVYLAKKNIEYFEGFWEEIEAMIIPEATCAAMIKKDWVHALELDSEFHPEHRAENDAFIARLKKLLPKIEMASSWLYHHTELAKLLEGVEKSPRSITYHDPCHAKKVLGIFREPRALLQSGYTLREMRESDGCCGFGGISMQSSKYPLTLKVGVPKAQMIEESGAQIVSAECGACHMQLDNALTQIDSQVRFIHPLELIARSLRQRREA